MFDNDGVITHVGPGLRSVISRAADQSLFGLLTILRPLAFLIYPLFAHTGRALIEIQGQDDLRLRGVVARHGDGVLAYPLALRFKARSNAIA